MYDDLKLVMPMLKLIDLQAYDAGEMLPQRSYTLKS